MKTKCESYCLLIVQCQCNYNDKTNVRVTVFNVQNIYNNKPLGYYCFLLH